MTEGLGGEAMGEGAVLTVPSNPKFLSLVRNFTAGLALMAGLDEEAAAAVKLAVDEACANVIEHAYGGATDKEITLRYKKTRDTFEVTIDDDGAKARRESLKGRDLDDLRAGGLGMHFIERAFDVCELDESKEKGNRLRLVRHLKAQDVH
jgi:anti-sigma regulatory factor (Ser/Thr protein kinase)